MSFPMNKLIILRGNSGSGKTTVARTLQRRLGYHTMVISQDVVRREMLWVKDGPDTPALPLLIRLLEYGAAHCSVTILEGILDAQWYAPLFQRAGALYGEHIRAFYYDLPFEETLRRHQTKPSRMEFGEAEMRRWWKARDFLSDIQEEVLSQDLSLEETVDRILQAIEE